MGRGRAAADPAGDLGQREAQGLGHRHGRQVEVAGRAFERAAGIEGVAHGFWPPASRARRNRRLRSPAAAHARRQHGELALPEHHRELAHVRQEAQGPELVRGHQAHLVHAAEAADRAQEDVVEDGHGRAGDDLAFCPRHAAQGVVHRRDVHLLRAPGDAGLAGGAFPDHAAGEDLVALAQLHQAHQFVRPDVRPRRHRAPGGALGALEAGGQVGAGGPLDDGRRRRRRRRPGRMSDRVS